MRRKTLTANKSAKSVLRKVKRLSVEQYNVELDAAEMRIAKGKFILQHQLESNSAKW